MGGMSVGADSCLGRAMSLVAWGRVRVSVRVRVRVRVSVRVRV